MAGAVEAADYRRGGSCGNGGRQGGRMAAVWPARWSCGNVGRQSGGGRRRSGCRLPARWKLRQWGTARRNNGGGGEHRASPFWLAQSWSVLACTELVRFGTELEYDRLRGWGMWGQVAGLGCGPIAGSRGGWSRVGWGGNSEPVVALFYFPFVYSFTEGLVAAPSNFVITYIHKRNGNAMDIMSSFFTGR